MLHISNCFQKLGVKKFAKLKKFQSFESEQFQMFEKMAFNVQLYIISYIYFSIFIEVEIVSVTYTVM